jgi:NADPH:quinone reductase-like Zn-dependent oxidoreductase
VKAARIHAYDSVISLDEVARPVPAPDEVLLQVAATSFNPTEVALCAGVLRDMFPLELPYTLGWDVAGTVVEVGAEVRTLSVGDRVIGFLDGGAAAEYVTAPAGQFVAAPATIPLAHAAALPLAGLTAWQTVFEHARVGQGQRVLVNGAGGGIGGFAVQLAKHAGAYVIATASPRSAATVRQFGADALVDYTVTDVADALDAPVDAVLNVVGFSTEQAAAVIRRVKPGGVIISVSVPVDLPADARITASSMVARNDVRDLAELVALVNAGVVAVDVTASCPLADVGQVHAQSREGRVRGKVILTPA